MPDRKGRFTGREQIFVERYVATGDAAYAAEKAGYSSPRQAGSQNANNPAISAECRRRALATISEEILPLATKRHAAILSDDTVRGAPLNKAIELAYKYGLVVMEGASIKPDYELTGAELAASIELGKAALGVMIERQKTIEHEIAEIIDSPEAPLPAGSPASAFD